METIIFEHGKPATVGTTQKNLYVDVKPETLAVLAPYLEGPGYSSSRNRDYYVFREYGPDNFGIYAELEIFFTVENTKSTAHYLSDSVPRTELPLDFVMSAIDSLRLKKEALLDEQKKREEAVRIEAAQKKREKLEMEAQQQTARDLLASEIAEYQEEIKTLKNRLNIRDDEISTLRLKKEMTQAEIREALLDEIIEDGCIDRNEDVEIRYTVEKEEG